MTTVQTVQLEKKMAKSTAMVKAKEWEWTEDRERCFQMLLRGFPKVQIAAELDVSRTTIVAWSQHPVFAQRMEEELLDFANSSRLRRIRATGAFTDTITKLTGKALKDFERRPDSMKKLAIMRGLMSEFRSMRNEERLNYGDSTENHSFKGSLSHSGHVTTTTDQSFKQFLQQQLESGVINAEIVNQAADPKAAIIEAVQQVLTEGEVLRELDREQGIEHSDESRAAPTDSADATDDAA